MKEIGFVGRLSLQLFNKKTIAADKTAGA